MQAESGRATDGNASEGESREAPPPPESLTVRVSMACVDHLPRLRERDETREPLRISPDPCL